MKWRIAIPRWALLLALALVALIALFPMRLAIDWLGLDRAGLTARAVSGSVWDATLTEARFGGASLGDVEASLAPLPLLLGRAQIALANGDDLSARITVSRHRTAARIDRATLTALPVAGAVSIGRLDLANAEIAFANGQCVTASGRATAEIALPWIASAVPPLDARLRCEGGALLIPFAGPGGAERLNLSIRGDGRVTARAMLARIPAGLVPLLTAAGLDLQGESLRVERSWTLGQAAAD